MARYVRNPPNPWHSTYVDYLGAPPKAEVKVYEERARSILSKNDSPDVPFTFSVNPYRGCFHACAYCYARPSHEYLDFGAGSDFERKLVVKTNAPSLLRATFERRSWQGEPLVFSGNTDCYQPLEASYRLTRALLETCVAYRQPVGIITKAALIERDVDVLTALARVTRVRVFVSLAFARSDTARAMEPSTPSPKRRLATVRRLSAAGIDVGVAVAPIIPGLNDEELPELLEAAASAGARRAFRVMLRLPGPVVQVFEDRLRETLPMRADKVLNAIREARGGALNVAEFGKRMKGEGERWRATAQLFDATCQRVGLAYGPGEPPLSTSFRRPTAQLGLFDPAPSGLQA